MARQPKVDKLDRKKFFSPKTPTETDLAQNPVQMLCRLLY